LRERGPTRECHRDREPEPPSPRSAELSSDNPLEQYFRSNKKRLIHKWVHYFDIYHRHFERFRGKPVTVLEFGVSQGGSLQMWRHYFGRKARIYGVDIDPRCADLGGRRTRVFIGDQEDREFLRSIAAEIGPIDVLIEDGGHHMGQQIATFEELYPHVKEDGVFLIEDLHTSYWKNYGGGHRRPGTFIEYAKGLTDQLNAWYSREDDFEVDEFTRTTKSIHFYDSIVVFEKGTVVKPTHEKTGRRQFRHKDPVG
jgi:cephalosporin hydroxylase